MIREATKVDIGSIADLGEIIVPQSTAAQIGKFDRDGFEEYMGAILDAPNAVTYVNDDKGIDAAICGLVAPFYFCVGKKFFSLLYWWVHPEKRGRGLGKSLLERVEKEMQKAEVDYMLLGIMGRKNQAKQIAASAGYTSLELVLGKEV